MRDEETHKLVYLENLSCKALNQDPATGLGGRECLYNSVADEDAGTELTYNFTTGIWGREDGRKFKNGERVE